MIHGPIKYTFGKYRRQVSREKPPRYRSSSGRGAVSCFFAARNPLFSLEKRLYTRLISFKFRPPSPRPSCPGRSFRTTEKQATTALLVDNANGGTSSTLEKTRALLGFRARKHGTGSWAQLPAVLREQRQPNPRFNHWEISLRRE